MDRSLRGAGDLAELLVIGVDNKDVLETAMRLRDRRRRRRLIVLAEADVVILAAPARQNIALLAELDENVRQPAVVTDVGSTKRAIVEAARTLPARFTVRRRTSAGRRGEGGLEHARTDLFRAGLAADAVRRRQR